MMKPVLIDTDILSQFFRNHTRVLSHFREYLANHNTISLSIITYYEVLSGLKFRDARKQLAAFQEFVGCNTIVPLSEESICNSANIYALLRKSGQPLDDIDILIAGVAMANDLVPVTGNVSHFARIDGLTIQDWT